jgi:hypothetical protein
MRQRVALLTNFIPPYRAPLYRALAGQAEELRIYLSTPMEPNRPWPTDWRGLTVTIQRNLTLQMVGRHPRGFSERLYVHIPYDTLWLLARYRPTVVISCELGLRTLQAALYRLIAPKSRLIVWATLSEQSEQGRGRLRTWLRRWILRRADAVLVNGESGARYIGRFAVPPRHIFRAPYTTEMSAFTATPPHRTPDQAYRLLYAGQFVERKGLVPFLTVLARWGESHPDRAVEFWLAGDGPLRTMLHAMPLPRNVTLRFLGNVAYDDLPGLYAQVGIFVLPTLADEWGVVVNEALASGVPVLGSMYSQAVEELVHDTTTGWTFHSGCADEIYAALDCALTTPPEMLDAMRPRAREAVRDLTAPLIGQRIVAAIRFVTGARKQTNSP